jgi:hypothetical protein
MRTRNNVWGVLADQAFDENTPSGAAGSLGRGGSRPPLPKECPVARNASIAPPSLTVCCRLPSLSSPSWLQHHLEAVVLLVQEDLIPVGRVLEPHVVRDDETRVDLSLLDALKQRAQVALHVRLAGLDGQ